MKVTRTSQLTGVTRTKELDVSQEQLDRYSDTERTELVQDIFTNLSAGDREFIMTGNTEQEWEEAFPEID